MKIRYNYVILLRVSTRRQGKSGLGLLSQKEACENYVRDNGGQILEIITEIESGSNRERISALESPDLETLLQRREGLKKALEIAKREGATILVKEYSRLTRFSSLMNKLLDDGVDFIAADTPNQPPAEKKRQTLYNEEEAKKTSQRTIAALAQLKKTRKLGNVKNFTNATRKLGNLALRKKALQNKSILSIMNSIYLLRTKNRLSYRHIADILNENGSLSPKGRPFFGMTVYILFHRKLELLKEQKKISDKTK